MGIEQQIYGPPGTGKTTYVTKQVKNSCEKYGPEEIFIASFTKAAAAELAGRDLPIGKEQIGTLHAHCYRALGRPTIAETIIPEWNEYSPQFALSVGGSIDPDDPAVDQTFATEGDRIFMEYQVLRAKQRPRDLWKSDVIAFSERWDDWKQSVEALDFTDMIENALNEISVAPGAPSVGFIDEAQDMSQIELALVRKWSKHMEVLTVVGDDDQCIYAFKGASTEAFLGHKVPEEHKRVLSQSYRVPRAVQELAIRWIEKVSKREPKEYKPRDFEGSVSKAQRGNWKNPEPLLQQMSDLLEAGKTVMILGSCSYMLEPIKAVLRQNGIPFHNPYRKSRGDWNPLGGGRGTSSAARLLAYLRMDAEVWGDQARLWTPADLQKWTEIIKAKGILQRGAKGKIDQLEGDVESVNDEVLANFFEPDALADIFSSNMNWFADNLLAAKQAGMDFPLQIARKYGARMLMEKPKVVLGSIHSVKGGEADHVFLFPDISTNSMREWTGSAEQRDSIIRQYYVGMTRAREGLILVPPGTSYYVNLGAV